MDAPQHHDYSEAATVGMKILGAVIAFLTFRWMMKIFKGKDGEFSMSEFLKFAGFVMFTFAGGYMIFKEGTREHEWNIYSEWYIAIVFGALLSILHLDAALDKILKIMQAIVNMKSKSVTTSTTISSTTDESK